MSWFGNFLVVYWVSNALASVAFIGKERKPFTPGVAVALVAWFALLIWGAVTVGTG